MSKKQKLLIAGAALFAAPAIKSFCFLFMTFFDLQFCDFSCPLFYPAVFYLLWCHIVAPAALARPLLSPALPSKAKPAARSDAPLSAASV